MPDDPNADASPEWLHLLETTVRRATEEIGRLRSDNGALRERVDQLESELADARETHGSKIAELDKRLARAREAADSSPDEAAEAWRTERSEIRDRIERLTGKLEGLLEESDDESGA